MCDASTSAPSPSLRIQIPHDAAPGELAAIVRALVAVPGVLEEVPELAPVPLPVPLPVPAGAPFIAPLIAPLLKALRPGGPAHQLRDAGTVRTLSTAEVDRRVAEAEAGMAAACGELVRLLRGNLEAWAAAVELSRVGGRGGQLSLERLALLRGRIWNTIERDARAIIREAYRAMWMRGRAAAGNFAPLSPDEEKQLAKMYRAQQNYFLNLLHDVEAGTHAMPFEQRLALYGSALRQAFHAGRVLADLSPDVYFQWTVGASEHCGDCVRIARGGRWKCGIYSARELARLGLFPGAGHTLCLVLCKCHLIRVRRPSERPMGKELQVLSDLRLVGPSPGANSFNTGGRGGREHLARRVKRHAWNHKGRSQ